VASAAEVVAGADALAAGVPPEVLQRIRALSPRRSAAVALGVLAQLVSRGVPPARAAESVTGLLGRGARPAQLMALDDAVQLDVATGVPPATALAVRAGALATALPVDGAAEVTGRSGGDASAPWAHVERRGGDVSPRPAGRGRAPEPKRRRGTAAPARVWYLRGHADDARPGPPPSAPRALRARGGGALAASPFGALGAQRVLAPDDASGAERPLALEVGVIGVAQRGTPSVLAPVLGLEWTGRRASRTPLRAEAWTALGGARWSGQVALEVAHRLGAADRPFEIAGGASAQQFPGAAALASGELSARQHVVGALAARPAGGWLGAGVAASSAARPRSLAYTPSWAAGARRGAPGAWRWPRAASGRGSTARSPAMCTPPPSSYPRPCRRRR
jgi:hypothetical protein